MVTEVIIPPSAGEVVGGAIIPRFVPVSYALPSGNINEVPANPRGQENQAPIVPLSLANLGTFVITKLCRSTYEVNNVRVGKVTVDDSAASELVDCAGSSVNYASGEVRFDPQDGYTENEQQTERSITGGASFDASTATVSQTAYTWQTSTPKEDSWADGSNIRVRYALDAVAPNNAVENFDPGPVVINLLSRTKRSIVPGSLCFVWGFESDYDTGNQSIGYSPTNARIYFDRDGVIYRNLESQTQIATVAGTIDYRTGRVELTDYDTVAADTPVTIRSMLLAYGEPVTPEVFFRTASAPIRPASLNIQAVTPSGEQITGSSDFSGNITGTKMRGEVDYNSGVVQLEFGTVNGSSWEPIDVSPRQITYNAVAFTFVPVDPELIGLDPVRLPQDGRVPAFRPGMAVVVHNTIQENLAQPLSAGQVVTVSRGNLDNMSIRDQNDAKIPSNLYTVDLVAGSVTFADPLDLSGYTQPLVAFHRIEEMRQVSEVAISGQVTVTQAMTKNFPADTTLISGVLPFGDLQASVSNFFEQQTWTNVWSDDLIGSATTAQYDSLNFPLVVSNEAAVNQRWAIIFTSTTTFNVVGEELGIIATGNTSTNTTPLNPVTGLPYFSILASGWGSGWSVNNVVRFNTSGANAPIWMARTTLQGPPTEATDSFTLELRGDAD